MKTIRIIRTWDDHEPVILGRIKFPPGKTEDEVTKDVEELFVKFQEGHPNFDTEFVAFLKKHGYKEVPDKDMDIVLG
jgi:hypothetical protein